MWRKLIGVLGGIVLFVVLLGLIGMARYRLYKAGLFTYEGLVVGMIHYALPAFFSGLFVGAMVRTKPCLWSLPILGVFVAWITYVMVFILHVHYHELISWNLAGLAFSLMTLFAGATLGSRIGKRREGSE